MINGRLSHERGTERQTASVDAEVALAALPPAHPQRGDPAVLLAVWWAVAALQLISPLFLPPPGQVLQKLITIAGPQGFMDATLWQHLAASLTRIVIALLAAVLIGVPVGIAMGLNSTVRGILDPLIELYRPVPPLAYLPLMVIWFGIGETSKILLIYLAIFAPVAMSALAG